MFKRSFVLASAVLLTAFVSSFAAQLWVTRDLPSSYDPGVSIGEAFKTSKNPLLIEFYSDDCGTCRRLSPVIHALREGPYKNSLTLVMMDVNDPANQAIARLFKVDSLPGVYVFDHRHMKKHPISPESFVSERTFRMAIDEALAKTRLPVSRKTVPATG